MENFFSFSAISGIQARQAYYTVNLTMGTVAKIFQKENTSLPADQRSQRIANTARINNIRDYILNNPNSFVIPPLVAYLRSGEILFTPIDKDNPHIGQLNISIDSDFGLFDGQHRCEGIKLAVKERPLLALENITIFLLPAPNLSAAQQVFADINMNAVQPPKSIKLLYNQRDAITAFTKSLIKENPLFAEYTDLERTNLPPNSDKLFTFSGLHQANKVLWKAMGDNSEKPILITHFWDSVMIALEEWQQLLDQAVHPELLRQNSLTAHSITWVALAETGAYLYSQFPDSREWINHIERITLSFDRKNPVWSRRVLNGDKITKAQKNILLMSNVMLSNINIALPPKQKELEQKFLEQLHQEKQAELPLGD